MAELSEIPKSKIQAAEEAVQLALASRWEEALAVNDQLMERFGPDAETCNRRGKALLELGRLDQELAAYQETLRLHPHNQIAARQADKVRELREAAEAVAPVSASVDVNVFTDEPGKTAVTRLVLASGIAPATVAPGDPVTVEVGDEAVAVRTLRGQDLGGVEPRLSQRILRLSKRGNRYAGAVTHVDGSGVQVILREVYQAPELAGTNSFPVRKVGGMNYRPYAKEAVLVRDEERPLAGDDEDEPSESGAVEIADELEGELGQFEDPAEEAEPAELDDDIRPEDEY